MKKTRFVVLLLCVALLMLTASCKKDADEGNDAPTDAITTESAPVTTLPDVTTENVTDEVTTENNTENTDPSVTDTMSAEECFEYATEELYELLGSIKNGFMPKIFDTDSVSDGGSMKISADRASIFGSPVLNSAFALSGEYVKNSDGLVSTGELDGESKLGYQLYITDSGDVYFCLPEIEENTYISLDAGKALGSFDGDEDGEDESSSVSTGTIFEILDEVFGDATDKLITEETLEITVYGKKYSARKLNFNYVMTNTSAETYGVESVSLDFYVVGDHVLRAEFNLAGNNANTVLSFDFNYVDSKTEFKGTLESDGDKTFDFEGEIADSLESGNITFNLASVGTDLGEAGLSLSYERREESGSVFTDYVFGIVVSAGVSEMTVGIPIHTEYKTDENGDVSFKLSIDTVKDNIPKLLAEVKLSFEMTRLASGTEGNVVFPEFTDGNTIRVDDENDREALQEYYTKLNEQFPDVKTLIVDLLKLLGVKLPGSDEAVYLNGTYAQKGIVSLTKFTFDESGNVVLTLIAYEIEGKYSIVGDEITLDFGEGHALTGTFPFENNDSSIVIDGTEYEKQ